MILKVTYKKPGLKSSEPPHSLYVKADSRSAALKQLEIKVPYARVLSVDIGIPMEIDSRVCTVLNESFDKLNEIGNDLHSEYGDLVFNLIAQGVRDWATEYEEEMV